MTCEEAYWAGVVDSYAKETYDDRIVLQSHANWKMVEALTNFLEGTYDKHHRHSKRRGYYVWIVMVGDLTKYRLLPNYSLRDKLWNLEV